MSLNLAEIAREKLPVNCLASYPGLTYILTKSSSCIGWIDMLGRRLPKNRRFSYEPRFYDPKKEEKEGRQIKFKRERSKSAARTRSLINLFILLGIIIYLIYFLSRIR